MQQEIFRRAQEQMMIEKQAERISELNVEITILKTQLEKLNNSIAPLKVKVESLSILQEAINSNPAVKLIWDDLLFMLKLSM